MKIIRKQECAEIICNQDIANKMLLLGMSYTKFVSYSNYSITKIIENVKDKKILAMDRRDLVQILELEKLSTSNVIQCPWKTLITILILDICQ